MTVEYGTINPCHKALGHASNNLDVVPPDKKYFERVQFCFFVKIF
jgi:hypothetical protein